MVNALSVDVEDWYQVHSFRDSITSADWDSCPSRIVNNTERVLDLFDEYRVRGTFFVLGYVAHRYPELVMEIARRGHEVSTHGYMHVAIPEQKREEFVEDLRKSVTLLQKITKKRVLGYRAPSWSLTKGNWEMVVNALINNELMYDSSIYPIRLRYGIHDACRFASEVRDGFYEIPLSTMRIFNNNVPIGGGFFLRATPYGFTRWCIRRLNRAGARAVVYFHTWEIDRQTPRIHASISRKFVHYYKISSMERKICALLRDFSFDSIENVFLHGRA